MDNQQNINYQNNVNQQPTQPNAPSAQPATSVNASQPAGTQAPLTSQHPHAPQQPPFAPPQGSYAVPGPYAYYYPQAPKPPKKRNTGMIIFFCILAAVLVFGFGVMVANLFKHAASSPGTTEPETNVSEEFDSLNDNALKPGVDSGNNDLKIVTRAPNGESLSASQIAKASKNCVLGISVYSTDGMLDGEASGIVAGVNSKKTKTYIVTCAHVIEDAENDVFKVVDAQGKEYLAAVVGYDLSCDVGVLSVEKVGFKTAEFGDSARVSAGDTVVAVGNPGGSEFYGSVTQGIVSATDRMLVSSDNSIFCIQHDAAINPGSSGGALFNRYGQVIGINYSKIAMEYYEGMNFAVPSKTVVETANKIIARGIKTRGVRIGIEYYVAASYFDENYKQLVINSIDEKSDMYGKVQKGDFIVAVNGKKITDKYTIVKAIMNKEAGDTIRLSIAHKNEKTGKFETREISVKLIEK